MESKQQSWITPTVTLLVGLIIGFFVGNAVKSSGTSTTTSGPEIDTGNVTKQQKITKLDITLVNHIQMKLPEQDVFIETKDTPKGQVMRVEGEAATDKANLSKTAFASSEAINHDPFKTGAKPLGPFPKGKDLGFTLGKWLSAKGSGTYTTVGSEATLDLAFKNLVANGTYTVWCSRLTFPPNPKIVDRPCGAPDGSESSFKADKDGNGKIMIKMQPLAESSKETATVIALAYHSDGKTYGALPGDFAKVTHVQLAYLLPVPK